MMREHAALGLPSPLPRWVSQGGKVRQPPRLIGGRVGDHLERSVMPIGQISVRKAVDRRGNVGTSGSLLLIAFAPNGKPWATFVRRAVGNVALLHEGVIGC
jgi:hypothetical protein